MSNREALPAGTVLDRRFRVDEILGSGGFGITYLAYDLGLQAPVAIKEYFPAQFATREVSLSISVRSHDRAIFDRLRSSFLREAQTLAQLDHPGIVRVYSVFETHGTAYMVMRFERGKSMKLWLEELGRPPLQAELDQLMETLLSALHHLHGLNFLHRDIAPDNIIIRPDMSPVLVDFGASRRLAGELTASITGVVKEGYSPQEQYTVNAKGQGPWSDIYSMAATLYRAVTGRKPDEATARMLADTTEPLVRAAGPGYRVEFLAAIDKAMSLLPIDRPQSVEEWGAALFDRAPAELRSALTATVAAFPERSAHPSPHSEPPRARGRGGKVAAAAVIAALLIVPAAIAYRPAVIEDVAGLWLSVTQSQQEAENKEVPPPLSDPAAQRHGSERAAREQAEARIRAEDALAREVAEGQAKAEEARAQEEIEVRAKAEREAREREVAARAQQAAEAAVRLKAEERAKAEEVILGQKLRDAAERAKAESEARAREAAERENRATAEREKRERLEAAREKAEAERQAALEAEVRRLRDAEDSRVEQARIEAARRNAEKQAVERRRIEEELVIARARIAAQAEALRKAEEATRIARLAAEKAKPEAKEPETRVASLPKATPARPTGNFDGRWTLTRVGENCFAGSVRSFSFRIDGLNTTNGRGKITNTGGFVYKGQSKRSGRPMHFSGKLTGRKGRGTFYTDGGRCAGTFTVSRE